MIYCKLTALEKRFKEICDSPKFSSLDSVQLLQELVSAEYDYRKEDRLDRLLRLSRLGKNTALASNLKSEPAKYNKKLKYFGKIQVLILDDFLITHINEERASILFQLIKLREVFGTSTVVTCQYPADDWGDFMGEQNKPALSDSIRRQLTSSFILNIETA